MARSAARRSSSRRRRDTAIVRYTVTDDVDTGTGRQPYRMFMTQTWVRIGADWVCLAGHTGPRL